MSEHIVNSLNPRTPSSETVLESLHSDPVPGQAPIPSDPPVPGEPPVPTDPPIIPPTVRHDFEQPADNRPLASDIPGKGLTSFLDE